MLCSRICLPDHFVSCFFFFIQLWFHAVTTFHPSLQLLNKLFLFWTSLASSCRI
uniref:Uncharacterized protein n=1 Tax=Rhizophora mucronata TaxID=61149 RepID=A0A2P2QHN1_RHIMU